MCIYVACRPVFIAKNPNSKISVKFFKKKQLKIIIKNILGCYPLHVASIPDPFTSRCCYPLHAPIPLLSPISSPRTRCSLSLAVVAGDSSPSSSSSTPLTREIFISSSTQSSAQIRQLHLGAHLPSRDFPSAHLPTVQLELPRPSSSQPWSSSTCSSPSPSPQAGARSAPLSKLARELLPSAAR